MPAILATITTYEPEPELLEANLRALAAQGECDRILVYDNASSNRAEVAELCERYGAEVVFNDTNTGVAGPLHDGAKYALEHGYKYIFTLDQDSVLPPGYIAALRAAMEADGAIAMIGGTPDGSDVPPDELTVTERCEYTDCVFTSGTLADVAAIERAGGYIPELFIDNVDMEICYRLIRMGREVAKSESKFRHRLGMPVAHRLLWRKVSSMNYSPMRLYHMARNIRFCRLVYKGNKRIENSIKRVESAIRKRAIVTAIFEKQRFAKLMALKKGKKDAKKFTAEIVEKYGLRENKENDK